MYKVLIVDDEKIIRMGIKNILPWEVLNVSEVHTAASGREALELVAAHTPELIITDISMAEMTGLELIEQIRKVDKECRIIVLTGYDRFDYARKALQLCAQDFLLKPVDEEVLAEAVRQQITELEAQRQQAEAAEQAIRTKGVFQQTRMEMLLGDLVAGVDNPSLRAEFFQNFSFSPDLRIRVGILLPDISSSESVDNRFFRRLAIKNICLSTLDEQNCGLSFSNKEGRIVIVFFVDKLSGDLEDTLLSLIELLENECGGRMRVILGSEQTGFDNLSISYNDAVFAMENEQAEWRDIVKSPWEQKREKMFQDIYLEFKHSIIRSMDDVEQLLHAYRRFLRALESYNVSDSYASRCCFEIVAAVYFTLIRNGGAAVNERLDELLQSINGVDRINAGRVTLNFLENLFAADSGSEHETVRRVKQLIGENLSGNLSVTSLAAEVYVSANYLSRVFKKTVGEGCNEYIVRKRIEKAKLLLKTTSLKTGEIASLVGYQDINYFSLAFKRKTGVSPTKFRAEERQG